jgi:rhodanese-related sulfurtransferase
MKPFLRHLLSVGIAALLTACASSPQAPAPVDAPSEAVKSEVPYSEPIDESLLKSFQAGNHPFTLIDARSPEEYAAFHLTGAINVPLEAVAPDNEVLPASRDEPILVYCKSGRRATKVTAALTEQGYTNVRVLPSLQLMYHEDSVEFKFGN